jgi:hypothetical protein
MESVIFGLPQLNFIHDQNGRAKWLTPTCLLRADLLCGGSSDDRRYSIAAPINEAPATKS